MTQQQQSDLRAQLDAHAIQHREFSLRASSLNEREVEGIAVPWGQVANLGWFTEDFERGAVQDSDDAQLWWRHGDPIGKLVAASDADTGWQIRAKISATALGDEALTLVRDGVVTRFSVGFEPIEYKIREDDDGSVHITHTKVRVREVSLVPLPAYDGAQVTNVREGVPQRGNTMTAPTTVEPGTETREQPATGELPEVVSVIDREARAGVEDLERRFAMFGQQRDAAAPTARHLSPGEVLKRLAANDEALVREYAELMERAYTGGTTADSIVKDGWVGDLTRLVFDSAPLLSWFSSGTLPEAGLNIEYAQLKTNTVQVAEQVNEGDDLVYGKVQVETKTAPVKTYGGYSELSRREIDRSSVNILNTTLEAQASATGQRMNTVLRNTFLTAVAAQVTAGNTVEIPASGVDWADWLDAVVDAAIKFTNAPLGLPIDGLITNAVVFKALLRLEAADGRPVMLVQGADAQGNVIGSINPVALRGKLAGLDVLLDAGIPLTKADGPDVGTDPDVNEVAAFANKRALRSYISPVTRLQDENIINLSKQFSVYNYAAFANEIPAAIVPVVRSA